MVWHVWGTQKQHLISGFSTLCTTSPRQLPVSGILVDIAQRVGKACSRKVSTRKLVWPLKLAVKLRFCSPFLASLTTDSFPHFHSPLLWCMCRAKAISHHYCCEPQDFHRPLLEVGIVVLLWSRWECTLMRFVWFHSRHERTQKQITFSKVYGWWITL